MQRCFSCFKEFGEEYEVCPYCGTIVDREPAEPIHLMPGTVLFERYLIGKAAGAGGFGIIYKAFDTKLETVVAVKEFFVSRMMTRAQGGKDVIVSKKSAREFEYRKSRFLAEARTMVRFGTHRNIPNVFEFFEENKTAYIVMELLEGQGLNEYLRENGGAIDKDFAIMIAHEVGNALSSLHSNGIIHRDVAPDNIFICTGSEIKIKLLDFGAAKLADSTDDVIDIILKPGYSPAEQYDNKKKIGPWTDVYALGASLYVMLTGEKPEESTNRKIEDKVAYPNKLNPAISENLSNSIMKAMAIEEHLRFKTVEEFIKAIDGERKIIPVKQEKKRRILKRILGIGIMCIALGVVATAVLNYYHEKKSVQVLDNADISVWFCADSGSDEETAVQAVVDDFHSIFPNVNIDVRCYPEEEYNEKLEQASSEGNLPTLFESTGVSQSILANAMDATNVLESEQAESCLFLNQYDSYYDDKKCVPLGIEVPIAYVITKGATGVDYSDDTFKSTDDFETAVAIDDDYLELLSKNNLNLENYKTEEQFMNNESNQCAVFISSSMEMNNVRNTLTNYEKIYVYYAGENACARFTYEWSLGGGSKSEVAASERLLSWMLGNNYQNMLMISRCSDGQIPVNKECFNSKAELKYYAPLKKIYTKYKFER